MQFKKGCEGGLMTTTFKEEEGSKTGICLESNYPLHGHGGNVLAQHVHAGVRQHRY